MIFINIVILIFKELEMNDLTNIFHLMGLLDEPVNEKTDQETLNIIRNLNGKDLKRIGQIAKIPSYYSLRKQELSDIIIRKCIKNEF
jgi:hypothetical protein